jgi:hypothetical protein
MTKSALDLLTRIVVARNGDPLDYLATEYGWDPTCIICKAETPNDNSPRHVEDYGGTIAIKHTDDCPWPDAELLVAERKA